MTTLLLLLLALSIGLSLLMPLVPNRIVCSRIARLRRGITWLLAGQFVLAALLLGGVLIARFSGSAINGATPPLILKPFGVSLLYFDALSGLMCTLVAFVATIVARYSIRYLDGEAEQGRYYRWLSFSTGSVCLMVSSGNLAVMAAAWMATSGGLHQLLLHYRSRPLAQQTAQTKIVISRIGDVFLFAALVLTYRVFGTFEYSAIFPAIGSGAAEVASTAAASAITWTLVIAAVVKSAQFPFHVWLPGTIETPTPVSALMHAGIINAGGYLIIRTSPLMTLAPEALMTLAVIGAVTAAYGGIVMMAQPSIKRSLAYSTVAQMGFMMLQCGLGAFAVAMLHIVAHSLYKAHAFLNSGSVPLQPTDRLATASPQEAFDLSSDASAPTTPFANSARIAGFCAAALALTVFAVAGIQGIDFAIADAVLLGIFLVAMLIGTVQIRGFTMRSNALGETHRAFALSVLPMGIGYGIFYLGMRWLVEPSVVSITFPGGIYIVASAVAAIFLLAVFIQLSALAGRPPAWTRRLRIHAVNGFYVEAIYRRVFAPLGCS